jgi:phospholipid/cholesterol/gamma-HCH transport system substrate-binding protein
MKGISMRQVAKQPQTIGLILVAVVLLTFVALFQKDKISSQLMSGDTITAHFPKDYKLRPDVSAVKVAYVPVGKVTGVSRAVDGGADVVMKVDKEALAVLGSAPSATIRPTTLLGGSYFVDLQPGGNPGAFGAGSVIPAERTAVPVELDKVAGALQPNALTGLQHDVANLDRTFDQPGQQSVQRLLEASPETLGAGGRVLDAALGHHPNRDLTSVVSGLESTARVLAVKEGQLDGIVVDTDRITRVVAGRRAEVRESLDVLPTSLATARDGLGTLNTTLATLGAVSGDLRPVARELDRTLAKLTPVVHDARPTISDLRAAVHDATPVLADLVPVSVTATKIVGDVNGPVIDRVNGPVLSWLNSGYSGTGWYKQTHSDEPMYREVVGALAGLARATARMDGNGHAVGLQPGVGAGSVGGLPLSLEQMYSVLGAWNTRTPGTQLPEVRSGLTVDQLLNALKGGQ